MLICVFDAAEGRQHSHNTSDFPTEWTVSRR